MEKISACVVVHNEEKLLPRCLESLCGVIDDIVVVHDGACTDKTIEIARAYGARIFFQDFVGDAEEHRPFSYEQARNNWILQIDADEFLSTDLKNNLQLLVSDSKVAAYEILWPLWNGQKESQALWPYKRCLFRKDKISFLGIMHYVVNVDGEVRRTNFKLHHRPEYNNFSSHSFSKKWLPWARLQASYYVSDFSAIKKFNYQEKDWPKKVIWRRQYPLLLLPLEFLSATFKNILSGAYRAGFLGIKISFRTGFYRAAINYYIYKLKK